MEDQPIVVEPKKKNGKVYIPLIIVLITVLVIGFLWYKEYIKYIKTDDAYVDSESVSVSSKIMGRVAAEYVAEGDSVKKGMLLAILDTTDLLAQRDQAVAVMNQAVTTKAQTEASYTYDQESLKVLQVTVDRTTDDFNRAKVQFKENIITKENYDHVSKALEAAQAQFNASESSLNVSKAKIESSASAIKSAEAQVALIETQLKNTKLYAPMNGIIAKRWLVPGDITSVGQSIFTITNNENYWVIVYLEETSIAKIHIGQKALFKIDAFEGVNFSGKIFSTGSNTASQFSLIPPNNASGNFTKVTQRVPIKISIDATDKGDKVGAYKFLAGMSAEVKIVKD